MLLCMQQQCGHSVLGYLANTIMESCSISGRKSQSLACRAAALTISWRPSGSISYAKVLQYRIYVDKAYFASASLPRDCH